MSQKNKNRLQSDWMPRIKRTNHLYDVFYFIHMLSNNFEFLVVHLDLWLIAANK